MNKDDIVEVSFLKERYHKLQPYKTEYGICLIPEKDVILTESGLVFQEDRVIMNLPMIKHNYNPQWILDHLSFKEEAMSMCIKWPMEVKECLSCPSSIEIRLHDLAGIAIYVMDCLKKRAKEELEFQKHVSYQKECSTKLIKEIQTLKEEREEETFLENEKE